MKYERDLWWPDLVNEYEGAVAECIFNSFFLAKPHFSDLFSVADLGLCYGILPDSIHRLTVLTTLPLLLTCRIVGAFCKRLFDGFLAPGGFAVVLWAVTLLLHTLFSFKAVTL